MPNLLALFVAGITLAACAGYGAAWLRLFRLPPGRDPLRWIAAVALGMGTLAYAILAVGLAGALRLWVLAALVGAGLAAGAIAWRGAAKPAERAAAGPRPADVGERLLALAAVAGAVLLAAISLVFALRPPDGLEWDSLAYHLAAPRIYLREGRIPFIAYDSHTHFPFTMEMLFTLGLAFGGAPAAKLLHWAAGWLTAIAVGIWASRRETGGRRVPLWVGPLATLLFAGMPVTLWEMGTAYIDLGTALFQFLALVWALEATAGDQDGGEGRAAALAGVFSGLALGTKYTALIPFGLLGLFLLAALIRTRGAERRRRARALLAFGLLGAAVASPWYVKNWLWVHNPVYPFFYRLFPGSFSWNETLARAYENEQALFGMGRSPAALLRLFWNLAFHGRMFYINPTHGSLLGDKLGGVGAVWAGLLPLLLWARGLDRPARGVSIYAGLSLGIWFLMTQQVRYLLPVFAALAGATALVPAALDSRFLRAAAGCFIALALACQTATFAPFARAALDPVTGRVPEEAYLRATLPGLYEAAEFARSLPAGSRIAFYSENRGFYFDRNYFWANPGHHDLIPYDDLRDGAGLIATLRRFGITHVLINWDFSRDQKPARWYRLLMDAIRRGALQEVFRSEGAEFERRGVMVYEIR